MPPLPPRCCSAPPRSSGRRQPRPPLRQPLPRCAPAPPRLPRPPPLKASAELSWVQTSGNSSGQTIGAGLEAEYTPSPLKFGLKLGYLRQEADGVESARRFNSSLRAGYLLTKQIEAFVQGNYLENKYAGIDHLTGVEVGGSFTFLGGPVHELSADAGIGYAWESRLNLPYANDDLSYAAVRLGAKYQWNLSKTSFFREEPGILLDLAHSSNWKFYNMASINAGLTSIFSLKLGWTLAYQNQPAVGKVKTDSTTSAAIVASF